MVRRLLIGMLGGMLASAVGLVGVAPSSASSRGAIPARNIKSAVEVVDVGFSTLAPGPNDFSTDYENTVAAILRNPTSKVIGLVDYDFVVEDKAGKELERASGNHPYLLPGAEVVIVAPLLSTETDVAPATVRLEITENPDVYSRRKWERSFAPDPVQAGLSVPLEDAFTLSDVRYFSEGGVSDQGWVLGLVKNTSDVTLLQEPGVDVSCALLRGEAVIGGGTDFVPAMPAGETVGFQAGPIIGGLAPDEVRCNVTPGSARVAGPDDAKLTVLDSLFATFPTATGPTYHVAAIIKNGTDLYASLYGTRFEFYDSGGRFIGKADGFTADPTLPGAEVFATEINVPPYRFQGTPSRMVVRLGDTNFQTSKEIKQFDEFVPTAADWELLDVRYDDDSQGVSTSAVVGKAVNRAKATREISMVSCVLLRDGRLLGGGFDSLLDDVAPGGTAEFEASVANSLPSDEVRCIAVS
jgi:hypothetical protein